MRLLTPEELATLRAWFLPDRPGPLIGLHMLATGRGTCHVDRWPDPRAALVETAGNYSLIGSPDALHPDDLRPLIVGFVEAPDPWVPVLQAAFPDLQVWDRVFFALPPLPRFGLVDDDRARRLGPDDAPQIAALSDESSWIAKTWGGPTELATSAMAWGAFVDQQLAAVACVFFVGDSYEDIGVVTEPAFRGRGLSVACASRLCDDIQGRGRQPSWSTSSDNRASIRVAEKLGFVFERSDHLYIVGITIPATAHPPDA